MLLWINLNCGGNGLLSNTDKYIEELGNKEELEQIYQIYIRVQSGDKSALNELFKSVEVKPICKADEIYKKDRMSNMDNVLDVELALEREKNKLKDEWENSSDSRVTFQFPCLNKLLVAMKKDLLYGTKNTGYENGKKKTKSSHKKFYDGKYDVSDFNELMYEVITEIFNKKTDINSCLTLDGKKNKKYPICDGVNLLRNISYFTSRKINKRAKNSCLDIFDTGYYKEEIDEIGSYFDQKALKEFWELESLESESWESEGDTSRLSIYSEYLGWLKRYDIHKLFKANACDIHAILDTIMDNDDVFKIDKSGDKEIGFGMRFVTQKKLQKIIQSSLKMNIAQENLSADLKIIEQRLLDHLLYSLNYRIDKASKSDGIFEKESERFLYELDEKKYIKIFSRSSYDIYEKSIKFLDSGDYKDYFRTIKKYEDMVIEIITLGKRKNNYDMVDLILKDDTDLANDKVEVLFNIANTIIPYFKNKEDEYRKNQLDNYKLKGFVDWENKCWEAELEDKILKIRLRSRRDIKNPIRYIINRENLMVYCGCINLYFCDVERKECYCVPKNRRVICKSNKKHENFIEDVG